MQVYHKRSTRPSLLESLVGISVFFYIPWLHVFNCTITLALGRHHVFNCTITLGLGRQHFVNQFFCLHNFEKNTLLEGFIASEKSKHTQIYKYNSSCEKLGLNKLHLRGALGWKQVLQIHIHLFWYLHLVNKSLLVAFLLYLCQGLPKHLHCGCGNGTLRNKTPNR